MVSAHIVQQARTKATAMLEQAGIVLTMEEKAGLEVADFGLADLDNQGLEIVTYVNTNRYCAKEMVLFPHQTCPEHRHPMIEGKPGKMETFRCRWGRVFLYIDGEPTQALQARIPAKSALHYQVKHEIVLNPGEQFTISPDTRHWFQAGAEGAIVSEFSSTSHDESDIFTDPQIKRLPEVDR